MIEKETTLSTERVFNGKVVNVRVDTVLLPDGNTATRDIVEHPGAVTVVPMPDPETVILVRQYRHPIEQILLELPAGSLAKGEDPESCAFREMAEETGFRPQKLEKLVEFYAAPGYCEEILYVYVGTDLIPEQAEGDADEFIETVTVPLSEALKMIETGEIRDSKSIIGLLMVERKKQS